MSADVLRRAASLMREQAEKATPGPWKMWDGWGPTSDALYGVARFGPDDGDRIFHHDDSRDLYATAGDWEHIASWHPAVALAVADWLEATAEIEERTALAVTFDGGRMFGIAPPALAVARAYLGEPS